MNTQTLINLLKRYSPDEEVRFWCPTDQNYYYVDSLIEYRIYLTSYDKTKPVSYQQLINYLQSVLSKGSVLSKDILLRSLVDNQDFKIQ